MHFQIVTRGPRTLVLLFALAGCASGSTTVLAPVASGQPKFASAQAQAATDKVQVPANAKAQFEMHLYDYLDNWGRGFAVGDDLTLRYRFIQYDPGNQAARYFIGFGAGKGSLTIEVVFLDKSNTELAKINVGGEISMGPFGGDIDEAVSRAARQAADYALKNFHAGAKP